MPVPTLPNGDSQGDGDAPADALVRLAVARERELLTGNCLDVLQEAAAVRSSVTGSPVPTRAAWRFAIAHHRRGEFTTALGYCAAADPDAGDVAERALLAATHASVLWAQGSDECRAHADDALRLATESRDATALGHAWAAQALAHALEGDREQNLHAYEKSIEHATAADDHLTAIRARSNLGSLHNETGRHDEALRHLDVACDLAEIHSAGVHGAIAHINRSEALLALGRLDEALVEVGIARDLYRNADSPMICLALLAEADVHRIRGNAVRSAVTYREAVGRAAAVGNAQVLVPALAGLARTTVLDDPAMAMSYAKQSVEQPATVGVAAGVLAAGWISLTTGDRESAGQWADRAISEAGRRQQLPLLADALELRALVRQDTAPALEDLQEALAIWQESGNTPAMEINRVVTARLAGDRAAENAARHGLAALGVHVDAERIAGPMQAIGRADQPEVEIHTLGTFHIVVGGQPVALTSWPSRKSRELVKVLASKRGRPISRDTLADLLWPGILDTGNRLSVALSTARAALDPTKQHPPDRYLVADRQQVHLDLSTVALDVVEFERLAETALRAAQTGERDAVPLLQAAAALYPAPFLADEAAPEWADQARDELQELALQVKHALVNALRNSDDEQSAIPWLLALIAEDPYDEPAHLDLIMALEHAGRHGEARRAHRRYASCMTELGLEPQPLSALLRRAVPVPLNAPFLEQASQQRPTEHSLPEMPSLIGRRRERAELVDLLERHRCVTVTGVGGVGKTRLAVAAAQDVADELTDVWFVDLSATAEHPEQQVMTALGLAEQAGRQPSSALIDHLRARQALLLLDNCEHQLAPVRALVNALLHGCPDLRVLATSIERIGITDERVFALSPLSRINRATGGVEGSEAHELFVRRVRAAEPTFDADPELIAQVCEQCDGLPLAIELAAARCASLGVDGLLAGLDDRLRLLSGPDQNGSRHGSLRAVLDWSHDLLTQREQRLFRDLGVFSGWFDLEAASAVADMDATAAEIADLIGRLADKHLIERRIEAHASQWRMPEIVRGYARERLAASADAEAITSSFVAWALARTADLVDRCRGGAAWREEFDALAPSFHAALDDSTTAPERRLELALALATLEERRGSLSAAREAAETAIALARDTGDAYQLARAALGASLTGMLFGVTQDHRAALLWDALEALGSEDHPLRARVLARLATELYWSAQRDRSLELIDEAVALADRLHDDGTYAHVLSAQHYVTRGAGTLEQRLGLASRAIRHARLGGETQIELASRAAHAVDLLEAGDLPGMEHETADLLAAARQYDHPEFEWYAMTYQLVLALIRGDYHTADRLDAHAMERAREEQEFGIGLLFARVITDRRARSEEDLAQEQLDLAAMARRFPRVIVWRCELLLVDLACGATAEAAGRAKALADEVLAMSRNDAHWLLAATLTAEAVAAMPSAAEEYAAALEEALRPFADDLAIGGRVAAFRGSISHALGLLALARGDRERAVADLEHAVAVHERLGAVPFAERSRAALETARAGA